MLANKNTGCCSNNVRHQQQQQKQYQQQHQDLEEQQQIPQFSPFSCIPDLRPAPSFAHAQNTASAIPGGVVQSEVTSSGVNVTKTVFTVRARPDVDSPRLSEKLDELEALEGLVTLSTDPTVESTPSGIASDQTNQQESCETQNLESIATPESIDVDSRNIESKADGADFITETRSSCGSQGIKNSDLFNHETTGASQLNKDFIRVSNIPTAFPSTEGPTGTSTKSTTYPSNDSSRSITLRNNFTQTYSTAPPTRAPTVDFHLWELRRLACNGWGVHGHGGNPSLSGLNSACSLENNRGDFNRDHGIDPSPCVNHPSTTLSEYKSYSSTADKQYHSPTTVNVSTQTRSPSVKPFSLRFEKARQECRIDNTVHINGDTSKPEGKQYQDRQQQQQQQQQLFDQPPRLTGVLHHSADASGPELGNYSPFGSTSTTPRFCDKNNDGFNSSRSTSILSDSGTSSSIPSAIIHTAKPFSNRIQQHRVASRMAAVDSDPLDTVTSPHVSGSDDLEFPDSTTEAPTLKVEYVTKVWDAYISDFLLASDHINDAAIFDRATGTCIASSPGFHIKREEFQQLQRSLSSLTEATKNGVTLRGKHYKTYLADGRRGLMAKGAERSGCSACQTRTLLLVAVHDHTGKPARCNEEVMRLGDFFWAKGL